MLLRARKVNGAKEAAICRSELARLRRRRKLAQRAVMLSTMEALTICVVIALLFVSAFIKPQMGTLTAIAWILRMVLRISGLVNFAMETFVAASGQSKTGGADEGN